MVKLGEKRKLEHCIVCIYLLVLDPCLKNLSSHLSKNLGIIRLFAAQCLLLYPVLLSPATMELVTMLQDLLTVGAMVVFVEFTLHYSGSLH